MKESRLAIFRRKELSKTRCCKRDTWLSILTVIDFAREYQGVEMKRTLPVCTYSRQNNQCIGKRCPFSEVNYEKD